MRRRAIILASLAIGAAIYAASSDFVALAAPQRDDEKRTFAVSCVPKGGLTEEDRELAAEYLAENRDEMPAAPRTVASIAKATRLWTRECAESALPVPKKLTKLLSTPPDGTARFIFDRALVVVDTDSNRILARVEADR